MLWFSALCKDAKLEEQQDQGKKVEAEVKDIHWPAQASMNEHSQLFHQVGFRHEGGQADEQRSDKDEGEGQSGKPGHGGNLGLRVAQIVRQGCLGISTIWVTCTEVSSMDLPSVFTVGMPYFR